MSGGPAGRRAQADALAQSWQVGLALGAGTLVLGVVVTLLPTASLALIAVLLGVLMLLSGVFHLVRVFDSGEPHRIWLGIAGLLFVVIGIILIRHLDVTMALIGLVIGITWIVQGVVALIAGLAGGARQGRGWWVAFGVISLVAGVVVAATPLASLTALAILFGIWFIVMGVFEIIGALILRHGVRAAAR